MPASSTARRTMMVVNVIFAFLRVSSRKAVTPLLTASTPVIAVQPEEKTFSSSQRLTAVVAVGSGGSVVSEWGCPPLWSTCQPPTPITIRSIAETGK